MVETPIFMAIGTRGGVKGITPQQLREAKVEMVLANTCHLLARPGPEVVEKLGGLHRFMGWDGPLLTDSGGYQVFSLENLRKINDRTNEVEFASPYDGARLILSPATATRIQNQLGADIIMAFDECVKLPCTHQRLELAVERTIRWAQQSLEAHQRRDQWLFGIVQGGIDKQLRSYCAEQLKEMDFDGYAIGGLSVGEGHQEMIATVEHTTRLLPEDKPRYLMGVGTPRDLVKAVGLGVDMFDCVLPTRNGRNAFAFVRQGQLRLRNEKYKTDGRPLDEQCDCYTCRNFSRGYLRHLIMVKEMAGPILVSLHNLAFYQWLMDQTRQAIRQDRYGGWAAQWDVSYEEHDAQSEKEMVTKAQGCELTDHPGAPERKNLGNKRKKQIKS